jgi:hypothetical protein
VFNASESFLRDSSRIRCIPVNERAHFTGREDGVVRLNPELARRVLYTISL